MSDPEDSDPEIETPLPEPDEKPAALDDIVIEARRYAHFAVREILKVAQGKGGRGAQARTGAARLILELSRFVGSDAEDYIAPKQSRLPGLSAVPSASALTPQQREALKAELIRRRQQQSQQ